MTIAEDTDITQAIEALNRGDLILYPTDTVWGIGCDATDPEAVARVFALKCRADSKALITLVDSVAKAARIGGIDEEAYAAAADGPRPVTVVCPRAVGLAPNLTAADGSCAIRVTREPVSAELCRRFGRPIVSTSANISGLPAPAIFAEIAPEIVSGVAYAMTSRRSDTSRSLP